MKKAKLVVKDGCLRKVKRFRGDELVIPWTVTEMRKSALSKCKGLKRITVPGTLNLWSFQHSGCQSIDTMIFDGRTVEVNGFVDEDREFESPFAGYRNTLKKLVFRNVEKIGGKLFKGFDALGEVEFSDDLEVIGYKTFRGCGSLKKVTFPRELRFIGEEAFAYCKSLQNVIFSDGLEFINDSVFLGCELLGAVKLPAHLESIGVSAFEGCVKLKDIPVPKSVSRIGRKAFMNCRSLESINLPEGISYISQSAFEGCRALEEIVIPSTVTEIDDSAFRDCKALEKVILPEGLRVVADNAFLGCNALKELIIPDSIEDMVIPWQLERVEIPSKMIPSEDAVENIFLWRPYLKTLTIRGGDNRVVVNREEIRGKKDENKITISK